MLTTRECKRIPRDCDTRPSVGTLFDRLMKWRLIMSKFAAAAVLCSAGLALCSDVAMARCGCKTRGCAPAPACCAPAPICAAPAASCAPSCAAPTGTVPQSPNDALPPAPSAGLNGGKPSVAMSPSDSGRQTFRSYSYDSSGAQATPGSAGKSTGRSPAPVSNMFRADRKIRGLQ